MSWILFGQILALMLLGLLLIVAGHGSIVEKRREDAIKRKEAGL